MTRRKSKFSNTKEDIINNIYDVANKHEKDHITKAEIRRNIRPVARYGLHTLYEFRGKKYEFTSWTTKDTRFNFQR